MRSGRSWKLKALTAGALALMAASSFAGQVTFYERSQYQGRAMTVIDARPDLRGSAFGDRAFSIVVGDGRWEACTEPNFRGRCTELVPGNYGNLGMDLNGPVASVRQIGYDTAPERVVVVPDPVIPANSAASAVVINPGSAPIVISRAQNSVPVYSEPRQVIVGAATVDTIPVPAGPLVVLYQRTRQGTRAIELTASIDDLDARSFGRSADAAFVSGGIWRLCDRERGRGACTDFPPGRYENLGALDGKVKSAYLIAPGADRVVGVAPVLSGRAVLYQNPNFGGPSAVVEYGRAPDLDWAHFRNPATSARIESGSWLVCSDMAYQGECRVLEPGDYPVLTGALSSGIASAREIWRPELGNLDRRYRR